MLSVLRLEKDAPKDLHEKSVALAGHVLELSGNVRQGEGALIADRTLHEGRALRKFMAICEAQGGFREPVLAPHTASIVAPRAGAIESIDNRRLARVAKLAGAPHDLCAGLEVHVKLGQRVAAGQPLFTIHSESPGELGYARTFVEAGPDIFAIETEA